MNPPSPNLISPERSASSFPSASIRPAEPHPYGNPPTAQYHTSSESKPLLHDNLPAKSYNNRLPKLVQQPNGNISGAHSRFGLQAFLQDVSDIQAGTVPISVFIAVVIGILCGVASFLYNATLQFFLGFLWDTLPNEGVSRFPLWLPQFYWLWIPFICIPCALLVGLSIKALGPPGDLAYTVKCVHKMGYVPISHVPSMVAASQLSILGGGSLGPEAPLVAICGSIAGWVSINLFKQKYKNIVRKHTLCGMACALAAFFGAPLGGSLFALEINHRLGSEYFEHAIEAITSGTVCLVVFRSMAGLPIGPIWSFTENTLTESTAKMICAGAAIGLLGALIAMVFANGHWAVLRRLDRAGISEDPVKLSLFGGAGIIMLAVLIPHTLFWGENEIQTIGSLGPASALPHIWPKHGIFNFEISGFFTAALVGIAKLMAISFTVAGGYRGGFIFPFFASGAAFGRAFCFLFPSIPPVVAILSMAAGINVAITRTAIATPLILTALAGEVNATPAVLAASLTSVFVTYYMPFISSQQGREDVFESQIHSYTFRNMWGEEGENPEIEHNVPAQGETDVENQ